MRVFVTGATGFIGHAVCGALEREGYDVVRASRRGELAVDFANVPDEQWWESHLRGADVVVNAVGIIRETQGQSFDALHARAPAALFRACTRADVGFIVQVSALGADEQARTRYQTSKKAADDVLRSLPLDAAIVQPSLVYGPGGASTQLFNTLAASPLLMLPLRGSMKLQPVQVDDVIDGIVQLVRQRPRGIQTIAFVGPRAMDLREYLGQLRRALGIGRRPIVLPFPLAMFRAFAAMAGHVPGSALDRETAQMLLSGNTANAAAFTKLLGHSPRDVDAFVPTAAVDAMRTRAVLGVWTPVLRISLAIMWLWTGIVSLGLYPMQDSLALLARVGLHGMSALVALYGAAALDLLFGLCTLVLRSSHRRWLWRAQMLLIAAYTILISIFLPEYWLHPYGPIVKNLPVLAAIALLAALEKPR
jgi:uncharacterized protein YbjT (DUF2867 family)